MRLNRIRLNQVAIKSRDWCTWLLAWKFKWNILSLYKYITRPRVLLGSARHIRPVTGTEWIEYWNFDQIRRNKIIDFQGTDFWTRKFKFYDRRCALCRKSYRAKKIETVIFHCYFWPRARACSRSQKRISCFSSELIGDLFPFVLLAFSCVKQ